MEKFEIVSVDDFLTLVRNNPELSPKDLVKDDWQVLCRAGYEMDIRIRELENTDLSIYQMEDRSGWQGYWYPIHLIKKVKPDFVINVTTYFSNRRVRRPAKEEVDAEALELVEFFFPKPEVWFPDEALMGEVFKTISARNDSGGRTKINNNDNLIIYPKDRVPAGVFKELVPTSYELIAWASDHELWVALPKSEVCLFDYDCDPDNGEPEFKIYYPSGFKERIRKR